MAGIRSAEEHDNSVSDPWADIVQPKFEELLTEFKPSLLLKKLFSKMLLTRDEFTKLRSIKDEEEAAIDLLIEILPNKQHQHDAFRKFLSLLRSVPEQSHVADLLEKSDSGSTQTPHCSEQPTPTSHGSPSSKPTTTIQAARQPTPPTASRSTPPTASQPTPASFQKPHCSQSFSDREQTPITLSETAPAGSPGFDEVHQLLAEKREDIASQLDVNKVLERYQQDDFAGNLGRLSDEEVSKIREISRPNVRATKFLDYVAKGGSDSGKRLCFTLIGVQPEILELMSPHLRQQIKAETSAQTRKALDGAINDLPSNKTNLVIIVVGKTGVGKSTLVNCLLGMSDAKSGYGRPVTIKPEPYIRKMRNKQIEVWYTPGFRDRPGSEGDTRDHKYLTAMSKRLKKIDLLLFCLQADSRMREDDGISMRILTEALGKDVWEHGMIALTKANTIKDASGAIEDKKFFKQAIKSLTEHCREHLQTEAKLPRRSARDVPCVPTGSIRHLILKDGTEWLPEFWVTALERMSEDGATFLFHLNKNSLVKKNSGRRLWDATAQEQDRQGRFARFLKRDRDTTPDRVFEGREYGSGCYGKSSATARSLGSSQVGGGGNSTMTVTVGGNVTGSSARSAEDAQFAIPNKLTESQVKRVEEKSSNSLTSVLASL